MLQTLFVYNQKRVAPIRETQLENLAFFSLSFLIESLYFWRSNLIIRKRARAALCCERQLLMRIFCVFCAPRSTRESERTGKRARSRVFMRIASASVSVTRRRQRPQRRRR